jgi:hypothetical protein
MQRRTIYVLLCFSWLLASCSTPALTWRTRALALVDEVGHRDAARLKPQEYKNLLETFEHGETVLRVQGDDREADTFYLLALQKGSLLKDELLKLQQQAAVEEQLKAAELAARTEEERVLREAAKAEERLRELNRLKAAAEAAAAKAKSLVPALPSDYTVRRGETLPQIAGRTEIYNDASLWPIIYRANRDQIRDPKRLWPGQVLVIPRHFSRDEALEARRYSGRK